MAQSSFTSMETEKELLYDILRNQLTSRGIYSTENFWNGRDENEVKECIGLLLESLGKLLGGPTLTSDPKGPLAKAMRKITAYSRYYRSGEFERFGTLITALLVEKPKSDLEMYRFFDKEFNIPRNRSFQSTTSSRQPSSTATPVRTGTLSGFVDSSGKLSEIRPALQRELKYLMFLDVPSFLDHLIKHHTESESLLPNHTPALLLNPHKDFINQTFRERLENTSETSVLKWMSPLIEQIASSLKSKVPAQHSRAWRSQPTVPIKGIKSKRMLDGAIMSQYSKVDYHIQDVLVPFDLEESQKRNPALDLAKYVCEVFRAQPTRSYVLGFTMCGTLVRLWQFDRSGAIGSQSLNIQSTKEDLDKFLTLIVIFLTTNKQVLGFDSTFDYTDGQDSISTQLGHKFVIDRLIFRAPGICGRGTTCWQAHLLGDKDQKFLIKDSWQPDHHTEEGLMLRKVTTQNARNVARYHHHEDVHVASQQVDIRSYVRGGADFELCTKMRLTNESHDPLVPNKFTNRVQRRLILKDVGEPIYHVDCPIRLLEALEGCITGHKDLLEAGFLHRDISTNNLMINSRTDDPDRKSFLIDLDVAIDYSIQNAQKRHAKAGTKVFMSIHLLNGKNHDFVDDLESFFWVLIWICIHYPAEERIPSSVTGWNQQNLDTLGSLKFFAIHNPNKLTKDFTDTYADSALIDCVCQFAEIMRDPKVRDKDHWPAEKLYVRY
ncbi:hypothetical protein, variant [Puccinia triticina 1-1 BBBD Race 1]|uniref:Non-specific serine/threonine protein kinase n=1 Tax=Puccinia triticina (isolate 1-1 / race 1 (BBBD)) TaxID=630390 RepID=A0A180G757_PUCT1|nr:hypothetical protein PTTG_09551 [Puccinia triticina 1-1 BBBD Race 1]OAV88481.1 hypothetical protein, variant [Puccinia triticina 1-1 BBBD Race 1]